jgi:chemotaxis protein methyltransferase CheR
MDRLGGSPGQRLSARLSWRGLYGATSRPNHRAMAAGPLPALVLAGPQLFREPHHFDFLRDRVIPEARERAATGAARRLRIWCAARSSGEDAYAIAMIAHRELGRAGFAIEVVASDVDTEMLARAEAGAYSSAQLAEVPPELRAAYFTAAGDRWQVRDELRALIELHCVDLIHGELPFAGRFDAIFLRDVIIHLDRPSQATLVHRLRGYLAPTGYLFLGHSESLLHLTDAFALAGPTIYQARAQRPTRRRGRATVTRLPVQSLLVSRDPVRIDAVVGPAVAACVYDPTAQVGGMAQIDDEPARVVERSIDQLVAQLIELGAAQPALRAKLVGGGGGSPADRARGELAVRHAEAALVRAKIPLASRRVGGGHSLDIQFFTSSGRLLCRSHDPTNQG